jgi:two-component system, cell cycle sensor histidine kinase and response regulator CckA
VSIRKPTILLVDDEPIVRDVFGQALSHRGFEVILAADGQEGLRTFDERFDEIDVVVTDIAMPEMNGFEMAGQMFAREPHTRIILMTGFSEFAFIPEGLENICALLRKPFSPRLLAQTVDECLDSKRAERSAVAG